MMLVVGRGGRLTARTLLAVCALLLGACDPSNGSDPDTRAPDEGAGEDATDEGAPDASSLPLEFWGDASTPDAAVAPAVDAAAPGPDAAGTDAASAPVIDPCGDVPTAGRCRDDQHIELCVVATGPSQNRVETTACGADERCAQAGGHPSCVLKKSCVAGTTRCGTGGLETCAGDHWEASACAAPAQCTATPLGAFCSDVSATQAFAGRVQFERRTPNTTLTDWTSSTTLEPARGFLVLSYRGQTLVDAVVTSVDGEQPGSFSVRVSASPSGEDSLVVMAAGADETQQLAYVVANPGFMPSTGEHEAGTRDTDAAVWSYRFVVNALASDHLLTIAENKGSAACHVFDRLRRVYQMAHQQYHSTATESVVVWMGIGTVWDCGACSSWEPTKAFDSHFEHQVWLDGSRDQGYWSDAVTAHELGHYVMNAHGYPVGEGGPHYLGVPTQPGQAFTEGWATFFSSLSRNQPVYFDKQGGAFFWWDIDRRSYSPRGLLWLRAQPWLGLLQRMDENEAAAIMWQTYRGIGSEAPILAAIASDRMRDAPFARGYTRRVWSNPAFPDIYTSTDQPLPMLADFLDTLLCSNAIGADALQAILQPTTYYPYSTKSPLCQ